MGRSVPNSSWLMIGRHRGLMGVCAILASTLALTACQSVVATRIGTHRNTATEIPSPSPEPTTPATLVTPNQPSPSAVSTPASALPIASKTLTGTVIVPQELLSQLGAQIIGNNGSAIIANNAGGLIANNGGGLQVGGVNFRLQNVNQTPLANVEVLLEQADGTAVLGEDRLPVRARTDANGHYVLKGGIGLDNLLVKVALPSVGGELMALAHKDATEIDVDIASTLVMSYIVSNYVLTQNDPIATLNKLPPDLEAKVQTRAEAAIADGQVVTSSLSTDVLNKAVEGLRKADPTLDQHMETVKKLLVAAGLSDLGNGKPAIQVALPRIQDVLTAPDGSIYLCCPTEARVWKLRSDGILENAAGRAPNASDAVVEGLKATDVGISGLKWMSVGSDGSMLLTLSKRLLRVDATGITHLLWTGTQPQAAIALDDGKVLMLQAGTVAKASKRTSVPADPPKLWLIGDGNPQLLHTFATTEVEPLAQVRRFVKGKDGAYYLGIASYRGADRQRMPARVLRLDADTYALSEVRAKLTTDKLLTLTQEGEIITASSTPIQLGAGLTFAPQAGANQSAPSLSDLAPITRKPDGSLLVASNGWVFQVDTAGTKLLAGTLDSAKQMPADQLSLESPSKLALEPAGAMLIYDDGTRTIWRVEAGTATWYADLPTFSPDNTLLDVASLRCGENGDVLIGNLRDGQIYRLDHQGQLTKLFEAVDEGTISETLLAFEPLGHEILTLLKREDSIDENSSYHIMRLGADGSKLGEYPLETTFSGLQSFYKAPDDTLYLVDHGNKPLYKWQPGQAAVPIDSSQAPIFWIDIITPDLVVDKKGRVISATNGVIYRFDPVTNTTEVLVGPNGRFFNETNIDSGAGGKLANPCFDAAGNLYFVDADYRQIKRIAAQDLN